MSGFKCLAIETSTSVCSLALADGERCELRYLEDSRSSSRQLYTTVRALLDDLQVAVADLDCVAFGCGPGSFTGVRIAAGAAQAIAFAQSLPVCAVSSLAALALRADGDNPSGTVAACLDARMGEAYLGVYAVNNPGQPLELIADSLVQPGEFRLPESPGGVLAAGQGWSEYPELLANNSAVITSTQLDVWPDAMAVLDIAQQKFRAGDLLAAADALPNYLRDRVVQTR